MSMDERDDQRTRDEEPMREEDLRRDEEARRAEHDTGDEPRDDRYEDDE